MDLHSEPNIGMCFGTFELTINSVDEPLKQLIEAKQMHDAGEKKFNTKDAGDTRVIP